jgi:hypothetical protein
VSAGAIVGIVMILGCFGILVIHALVEMRAERIPDPLTPSEPRRVSSHVQLLDRHGEVERKLVDWQEGSWL